MSENEIEQLLAVINADKVMSRIFIARSEISQNRPARLTETDQKVRTSLEIALNCHRKGGCTPGQLQQLEKVACALEEVLA